LEPPKGPTKETDIIVVGSPNKSFVRACPECGSEKVYRDGLRYVPVGTPIQRFLCRTCGYRFSHGQNEKLAGPNGLERIRENLNGGSGSQRQRQNTLDRFRLAFKERRIRYFYNNNV